MDLSEVPIVSRPAHISLLRRVFRGLAVVATTAVMLAGCAKPATETTTNSSDLPFYSTADLTPEWVTPAARSKQHKIAPFVFQDQDGRKVTNTSLAGKIYVANFFFTGCPSICPKMAATFQTVQAAFAGQSDVELISHSVVPETDTPERLAEYAKKNQVTSGKWHLVTGDVGAIYTLARNAYFAEKRLGLEKKPDEFLHTENMFLVDRQGHIRGVYNATLTSEAIRVIEDIQTLRKEVG